MIALLGIDLGKNVCSLAGADASGAVVLRRRIRRSSLAAFVERLPSCIVAMEACCGAHHFAQLFEAAGHTVRLMPPEYVRPYVKSHKNDDRDAEAIAEAASRPNMRFVPTKSDAQLDVQALHRVRQRLVAERTALINQLRALLFERGLIIPKGRTRLDRWIREELPTAPGLSPRMQALVASLLQELRQIDERVRDLDREFEALCQRDPVAQRLRTVPGIGALNATALAAAVADPGSFGKGRDFAAWLGLVPRQVSTGGRSQLVGISKRGSTYMRVLLIHGARSALPGLARGDTRLGAWLRALLERAKRNVVVVALANKLARIAWAVMARREVFNLAAAA